jgi:hypothetical protein
MQAVLAFACMGPAGRADAGAFDWAQNAGATYFLVSVEFYYDSERDDPVLAALAPALGNSTCVWSYRSTSGGAGGWKSIQV